MNIWLTSLTSGFKLYRSLAPYFLLACLPMIVFKKDRCFFRYLLTEAFLLYMTFLFAMVFLPLPTFSEAESLKRNAQIIPFYAVYDLFTNFSVCALLGLVFNIVMTVPFGVFLNLLFGLSKKDALLIGLLLTLFIEVGQYTGLFFLFKGSYRLFDADDILTNVLGCGLGFLFANKLRVLISGSLFARLSAPLHGSHRHSSAPVWSASGLQAHRS